jgi:hypothetical protein
MGVTPWDVSTKNFQTLSGFHHRVARRLSSHETSAGISVTRHPSKFERVAISANITYFLGKDTEKNPLSSHQRLKV